MIQIILDDTIQYKKLNCKQSKKKANSTISNNNIEDIL